MMIDSREKIEIIGLFNQHRFDDIARKIEHRDIEGDFILLTIRGVLESIHQNNPEKAIKSFESALTLQPDKNAEIDVILNIADCYCQHQMDEKVSDVIHKYSHIFRYPSLLSNPNHDARSGLILAWDWFNKREYSNAINILTSIIEKNTCRGSLIETARYNRGMCYFQEKKYSEAEMDYKHLIVSKNFSEKTKLMSQFMQIENSLDQERFDEVIQKLSELDTDHKEIYIIKIAESAQNTSDDVVKNKILDLLDGINSGGQYPNALLWAGQYTYRMNQFDRSLGYLKKITELDSTQFILAQNLIGCIEYQKERYELATEHFKQAKKHFSRTLSPAQMKIIEENALITESSIS
jgi:tetratricopeptide (TPR) repeat protein